MAVAPEVCQLKDVAHHSVPPTVHPERNSGLRPGGGTLCSGESGKNGPQIIRYFQKKKYYEPRFLHLPILRKALKSLTETSVLHDQQEPCAEVCA